MEGAAGLLRPLRTASDRSSVVGAVAALCASSPFVILGIGLLWGLLAPEPPPDPSAQPDMFAGMEEFLAWLAANALGAVLFLIAAITALVLDILLMVRLRDVGLAAESLGAEVQGSSPLILAVLLGTGWISTPVLGLLAFLPVQIFGPGSATNAAIAVLVVLAYALPLLGRILQARAVRRVRLRPLATG